MEALKNQSIIYDDSCPMCKWYTGAFVEAGMLQAQHRMGFSEISWEAFPQLDKDRARHEIPLIDTDSGQVTYGMDALFKIIGTRFPLFQPLFQWRPFRMIIYPLYQIITYNRRLIAGSRPKDTGIDCAPDFHAFYRGLYMALALCFTLWMVHTFSPFLQLSLGILAFLSILPILFVPNRWDFAGQMATIWLTTVALIALPLAWLPSGLFVTGAAVTLGSIWFVRECRRRPWM